MSNFTLSPWGYAIDAESIPNFLTPADFQAYTGSKFSIADSRIVANIPSASASIRNYCGWHIAPNLLCSMTYNIRDLRDAFVGPDLLIQLPATHVTAITKVEIDGEELTEYEIGMGTGLLRVYDVGCRDRKSKITIEYRAGYPDGQISVIKELASNLVTHSLTNTYGVNSEAAGGVSVSYNSAWTGRGATSLSNDTREVLEPYKVKGVF